MNIRPVKGTWDSIECDALMIPLFEDDNDQEEFTSTLDQKLDGLLSELKSTGEWKAKVGQISVIYRPDQLGAGRLILLGAGKRKNYDVQSVRSLICGDDRASARERNCDRELGRLSATHRHPQG